MENDYNFIRSKASSETSLRACQSCQNCESLGKWRTAWIALVREIRRYGGDEKWPTADASCDLVRCTADDLQNVKLELLKKQAEYEEMKSDIRIACEMHTKLLSDENRAMGSLKRYLGNTSTELINSMKAARRDETTIITLKLENRLLTSKLQNLTEIMRVGYKELCKFLDDPAPGIDDLPPTLIAREIINKSCKYYMELQDTVKEIKLLRQTCVGMQNKLREATVTLEDLMRKNFQLEANYLSLKMFHENNHIKSTANLGDSIIASHDKNFPKEINDFEYSKNNIFIIDIRSKQNYVGVLQPAAEQVKCKIGEEILNNNHQCELSIVHSLLDKQDGMLRNLKMISEELNCCKLEERSMEDVTSDKQLEDTNSDTTIVLYPTSTKSQSDREVSLQHRRGRKDRLSRPRVMKNTLNVLRNNNSMSKLNRLNVFSLSDNYFNLKRHGNKEILYRHSC